MQYGALLVGYQGSAAIEAVVHLVQVGGIPANYGTLNGSGRAIQPQACGKDGGPARGATARGHQHQHADCSEQKDSPERGAAVCLYDCFTVGILVWYGTVWYGITEE